MYKFVRPLLFLLDPEVAHEAALKLARYGPLLGKPFISEQLRVRLWGLDFPNPVGLAAGFDKNAYLVDALGALGFGFVEVGTVTPKPQPGNPRPRLFRRPGEKALVNRMGFNNEGVAAVAKRLQERTSSVIVGANIGKNKDTLNHKAVDDYEACFKELYDLVDYIVVNVSSPNTPGLRELQEKQSLMKILSRLQETNIQNKPLLVKIAPELAPVQLDDILEVAQRTQLAGIVATNTIQTNEGGLSGKPLADRSTEVIRYLHQQGKGKIPIIGVGGVFSAEDAYKKIRAGASLVQLYTGLVYKGPGLVKQIHKELAGFLLMARKIRTIEGRFVNADGEFYGRVEIDEERGVIGRIGEKLGEADLVVEKGLIFPGFIDVHVHAREDASGKQTYKEDFASTAAAALHGGVVCVADMPNNLEPPVDDKSYAAKKKFSEDKPIDFLLYAGIGPHTKPLSFKVPYKVFMAPSVGDLYFKNFEQLEKTIIHYRGQAISFHCENPEMISALRQAQGKRPAEVEISAIDFALELIAKYNLQGKICHCSTKEGMEKIRRAKQAGVAVAAEVTPHHLYFEEPVTKVNPPIRSKDDRFALMEALRDGTIDYLASDHAPHTKEEKARGIAGMPHLDTYGAFATWLMAEHKFTPEDIARVCAYNPGQFVNQFDDRRYGKIEEGYAASFTIIDPNAPSRISAADLRTKCKWSPFEGVEFPGQVLYTIHKSRILYEADSSRS